MLTKTLALVLSIGFVAAQSGSRTQPRDEKNAPKPGMNTTDAWGGDWNKTAAEWEEWGKEWEKNATAWGDDWNKTMDQMGKNMTKWNESSQWDEDWKNWENEWNKNKTNYNNSQWNENDWFGNLINPPCEPECEVQNCEYGVFCTLTYCKNPCDGNVTCTQDTALEWDQWEQVDCSNGPVELKKECNIFCEYLSCADEGTDDVCWIEKCDDGCDFRNCSQWRQVDNEWFGEYCDTEEPVNFLPDVRIQDLASTISETGLKYQNTIEDAFKTFCPPGDEECLNGSKQIIDVLNGQIIPEQEPVSRNVTEQISQNVTAIAQMGAMQAAGFLNATVGPQIDMVLGNEAIKGLLDSFLNDTVTGFGGEDPQLRAARAGRAVMDANSTEELAQNMGGLQGAVDIVGSLLEENEDADGSLFGIFRQGLENVGLLRKDRRNN